MFQGINCIYLLSNLIFLDISSGRDSWGWGYDRSNRIPRGKERSCWGEGETGGNGETWGDTGERGWGQQGKLIQFRMMTVVESHSVVGEI